MAANPNTTLNTGGITNFRPEMPNVLLVRVCHDTNHMNAIRKELNDILGTFVQQDTVIPVYTMDRMLCYFMSTQRWSQIIEVIFHGMEPPLQRQADNRGYSYRFIEEHLMSQQHKIRVAEIGNNLAAAVWHYLTNSERIYLFGAIHGMNAYMGHMLHYLKLFTVQREVSDENEEQMNSQPQKKKARKQ
jgi:hypothetical protein